MGLTCSDLQTLSVQMDVIWEKLHYTSVLFSSKFVCSWPLLDAGCLASGHFGSFQHYVQSGISINYTQDLALLAFNS